MPEETNIPGPWLDYQPTCYRDKEFHDIELMDGQVIECCWPNGHGWYALHPYKSSPRDHYGDKEVKRIRLCEHPIDTRDRKLMVVDPGHPDFASHMLQASAGKHIIVVDPGKKDLPTPEEVARELGVPAPPRAKVKFGSPLYQDMFCGMAAGTLIDPSDYVSSTDYSPPTDADLEAIEAAKRKRERKAAAKAAQRQNK